MRQKFERDKARIRELGFDIETVTNDDGSVGYRIDPTSGYAPPIYFSARRGAGREAGAAVLRLWPSGAFSVFNDVPASDGGLEASNYYTPVLRALNLHRALAFDYLSAANKPRLVEPLVIDVFNGASYLVARVKDTSEIKGYRFSRMTSMPAVLPDPFEVERGDPGDRASVATRVRQVASTRSTSSCRPTRTTPTSWCASIPKPIAASKSNGKVEVGLTFESPRAALRFVLDGADRVRLQSPKSLKNELAAWLERRQSWRGARRHDALLRGVARQRRARPDPAAAPRRLRERGRACG